MFFRKVVTKINDKEYAYLKLIESYREGDKVKQRVIANLGSIENFTPEKVQSLIAGLSKIFNLNNRDVPAGKPVQLLPFGEIAAVNAIWNKLGITDHIANCLSEKKHTFSTLIKILTIYHLLEPLHNLPFHHWLNKIKNYIPDDLNLDDIEVALNHLTRSKEKLEETTFREFKHQGLITTSSTLVHLTKSCYTHHTSHHSETDFLPSIPEKNHLTIMFATCTNGIPLAYELVDEHHLHEQLFQLKSRLNLTHCIFIGNQNFLPDEITHLISSYGHTYIVGVGRRAINSKHLINFNLSDDNFHKLTDELWYYEIQHDGERYLICFNPLKARQKIVYLESKVDQLEKELYLLKKWLSNNNHLSPSQFYKAASILKDPYCKRFFQIYFDENNHTFSFRLNDNAVEQHKNMAGKYLIKTNAYHLTPAEILNAYGIHIAYRNQLQQIKELVTIKNQPFPLMIKAHLIIAHLSHLILKIMEFYLHQNEIRLDPYRVLKLLEDVKLVTFYGNTNHEYSFSPLTHTHQQIFSALGVKLNTCPKL